MATECSSREAIRHFLTERGGRVKNADLIQHFKFRASRRGGDDAGVRETFKSHVDSMAFVKVENGVKFVCLKKKYRRPATCDDGVGGDGAGGDGGGAGGDGAVSLVAVGGHGTSGVQCAEPSTGTTPPGDGVTPPGADHHHRMTGGDAHRPATASRDEATPPPLPPPPPLQEQRTSGQLLLRTSSSSSPSRATSGAPQPQGGGTLLLPGSGYGNNSEEAPPPPPAHPPRIDISTWLLEKTPEEETTRYPPVFSPLPAAAVSAAFDVMGNRWSSKSEETLSIERCTSAPAPPPPAPPAPPPPQASDVPQIAVIEASPLPAASDGSVFVLPAGECGTPAAATPNDEPNGPPEPVVDATTTTHGNSPGPTRDHRIQWVLPLEEHVDVDVDVDVDCHDDDDDDNGGGGDGGDKEKEEELGHLDLRRLSDCEEPLTPRGSRQNFIALMMDSSPQVRRTMATRNPSFLSARRSSRSDSDTASLVSSTGEEDAPAVTLDPLEHEWMLCASDGEWDSLRRLLASEPALVPKKDFVTGFNCLHWAAKQGKPELLALAVNFAKRHGVAVDINARAGCGYTPLHLAAMHNHVEVVKLLVGAYDADVELRDYSGRKASQYLAGGANVDLQDIIGVSDSPTDGGGSGDPAEGPARPWRLSRVLQPHLRLLGHSESMGGGDRQARPRMRPLRRMSSLGLGMKPKFQKLRDRTSQVVHGTSFRGATEVKSGGPGSNVFHRAHTP
ncbi:hypothetical protein NHX12_014568 [Muraenolepis orangiensis]|uniref:SOWAHA-C winged helix-turn-helix domain-containing protein n=1 Tax=Muraenolepis orangiensis TaxID=630683 RepID=A0A9Q0DCG5_9TELE|nr:hypothetical protein NHX12_014568 [Muraenolepis orangiensis]